MLDVSVFIREAPAGAFAESSHGEKQSIEFSRDRTVIFRDRERRDARSPRTDVPSTILPRRSDFISERRGSSRNNVPKPPRKKEVGSRLGL